MIESCTRISVDSQHEQGCQPSSAEMLELVSMVFCCSYRHSCVGRQMPLVRDTLDDLLHFDDHELRFPPAVITSAIVNTVALLCLRLDSGIEPFSAGALRDRRRTVRRDAGCTPGKGLCGLGSSRH